MGQGLRPKGWSRNKALSLDQPLGPRPSALGLESWDQVELPHPSAAGTIQRTDVVDFSDGESEGVEADGRADASRPLSISSRERWFRGARPRDASIGKDADFLGNAAVHRRRPEQPDERCAQLDIRNQHAAADQSVELR